MGQAQRHIPWQKPISTMQDYIADRMGSPKRWLDKWIVMDFNARRLSTHRTEELAKTACDRANANPELG